MRSLHRILKVLAPSIVLGAFGTISAALMTSAFAATPEVSAKPSLLPPPVRLEWVWVETFPSVDEVADRAYLARDLPRVLSVISPLIELEGFRAVPHPENPDRWIPQLKEIRVKLRESHRLNTPSSTPPPAAFAQRDQRVRDLHQKIEKLWTQVQPWIRAAWSLTEVAKSGDPQWDEDTVRVEVERVIRIAWDRVEAQAGALPEGSLREDLDERRRPSSRRVSVPLRYDPEGVTAKVGLWLNGRWASGRFLIDPSVQKSVIAPEWLAAQGFLIYEAIRPGIPLQSVSLIPALSGLAMPGLPGSTRKAGMRGLPLFADAVSWGGLEVEAVSFVSYNIDQPLLFGAKTACCAGVLGWDWLRRLQVEYEGGDAPRLWVSLGAPAESARVYAEKWEVADPAKQSFSRWFTDRSVRWYLDGPAGRWTKLSRSYPGPLKPILAGSTSQN